jgi:predicted Zn-dependent protease
VTFTLPHSRTHETEADRLGVELAARAGYDPHAAVNVWQKMLQAGGSGGPQFLSTHPSPETRLADLKVYADRVMPLYQQARR